MGNTHHHLFQSLLRGRTSGLNQSLTAWLRRHAVPVSAPRSMSTHFPSGGTRRAGGAAAIGMRATVADHNYLYWPDMPFDTSEIVFA